MAEISELEKIKNRLEGQPVEFACILAMRTALRVMPMLDCVFEENELDKRHEIIMPIFRALISISYAISNPNQARSAIDDTWNKIKLTENKFKERLEKSQKGFSEIFYLMDGNFNNPELINAHDEKEKLITTNQILNVLVGAVQSIVDFFNFKKGIGNSTAVIYTTISVVECAEKIIPAINFDTELLEGEDEEKQKNYLHIEEFWNAIELDIKQLFVEDSQDFQPMVIAKNLSEKALWLYEIPIWASRRWTELKRKLPIEEGWQVWVNWYEGILAGKKLDFSLETEVLGISDEDWEKGPARVNQIIGNRLKSQASSVPKVTENDVLNDVNEDKEIEIEGLEQSSQSWGNYPLDDLLIRNESRTVHDVIRRIDQGNFVMDPDFQRDFIWPEDKQSKLIESVIMRIPLPVFYMAEDDDGRMVVVDGLQRLSTFQSFINSKLRLKLPDRSELNNMRFSELPSKIQNRIEDCNLIFYIIDSKVPEGARLDIFERVNGGVALTRQQMRNCLFMGPATKFIKEESETEVFLKATGSSLNKKTMRDREFVNRFCAFQLLGVENYHGDMDDFLARSLRQMNKMKVDKLSDLSNQFRRGLENNFILFGQHAFRKRRSDQENRRSVLNASFWDVMSTGLSKYDKQRVLTGADKIRDAISSLFEDDEFNTAITYGPNDAKKVQKRFEMTRNVFKEVLDVNTH